MVGLEAALEIRVLHRHGKSIREIAREMGVSRNTVRRYLRDEEAARYKSRPPRPTKLDRFKGYVIERLRSAAPERIPGSVLLMELRERGYSGGYTRLKEFLASLKPPELVEPVIRFETGPGEQMQVDWAVIRRGENRLSVFVATLGWSRATYVEFVTDERVETLIEAHENAFLAFGGTPREVLYDNMRTVVLERHGYGSRSTPFPSRLSRLRPSLRFPPTAMRAVSGSDKGQGRAVHPLSTAQLLRPARQPASPGGADCRSRDRKPGGPAVAARGRECTRARHHRRDPGRTAGHRKNAVPAGPNALRRPQRALDAGQADAVADHRPAAPALVLRRLC
jgi:transposase